MKEKFLNFIKWFLIILGILFLIQLLLLSGIVIGFNSVKEPDIKIKNADLKEIQPIINYAENYRNENNIYPNEINIKIKKGNYEYQTSNNSKCFRIIYTYKNTKKDYSYCKEQNENSNSATESFTQSY